LPGNFGVLGIVLQGLNLGLQFDMQIKKIKVYTLTNEGSSPKCIGTMKREDCFISHMLFINEHLMVEVVSIYYISQMHEDDELTLNLIQRKLGIMFS
jgi:hypothetical protein